PGGPAQRRSHPPTAPPPPLAQLRPGAPRSVAAVVGRLLANRPEDRFQTPADLVAALDRLLAAPTAATALLTRPEPLPPEPESEFAFEAAPEPPAPRRRRWPWVSLAGGVLAVGVVVAVLASGGRKTDDGAAAGPNPPPPQGGP